VLYKPNDTIAVRCNDTYAPVVPKTTCTDNRTWDPHPNCTNITCAVPEEENGQFYFNEQPVNADFLLATGSEIQLSCYVGYTPIPANTLLTCQTTGKWSKQESNCTRITCSDLPLNFTNGGYQTGVRSQLYNFNHTISPFCFEGFYLKNGTDRQCIGINEWSGGEPVCSLITCPSPNNFSYGSYNVSQREYTYGDVLVPLCDTGYYIANDVMERVCNQNDIWSGDNPLCNIVQCDEPSVANGMIASNLTSFNYSAQIEIECHMGYEIIEGSTIRTCQDDGTWGPQPLDCDTITCNDTSEVFHKAITSDPLLILKFGEVQNVTVNTTYFYLMSGSVSVNCSWDRKLKWISPPELGMHISIRINVCNLTTRYCRHLIQFKECLKWVCS